MDEVFGEENFISQIGFAITTGAAADAISAILDTIIWYAKNNKNAKIGELYWLQSPGKEGAKEYKRVEIADGDLLPISRFCGGKLMLSPGARIVATGDISSKGGDDPDVTFLSSCGPITLSYKPNRHWNPVYHEFVDYGKLGVFFVSPVFGVVNAVLKIARIAHLPTYGMI